MKKLFNKQTVIAVLLTAVMFFGIGSFAHPVKAWEPCKHENATYDVGNVICMYRGMCGTPNYISVLISCPDCDETMDYVNTQEIAQHDYSNTFINPTDGKVYEICQYCFGTRLKNSESEEPTEPETDHVHNYNKKGKCKICGQMMP